MLPKSLQCSFCGMEGKMYLNKIQEKGGFSLESHLFPLNRKRQQKKKNLLWCSEQNMLTEDSFCCVLTCFDGLWLTQSALQCQWQGKNNNTHFPFIGKHLHTNKEGRIKRLISLMNPIFNVNKSPLWPLLSPEYSKKAPPPHTQITSKENSPRSRVTEQSFHYIFKLFQNVK